MNHELRVAVTPDNLGYTALVWLYCPCGWFCSLPNCTDEETTDFYRSHLPPESPLS